MYYLQFVFIATIDMRFMIVIKIVMIMKIIMIMMIKMLKIMIIVILQHKAVAIN